MPGKKLFRRSRGTSSRLLAVAATEALERRTLLSGGTVPASPTFSLSNGIVTVNCDNSGDSVNLTTQPVATGTELIVTANSALQVYVLNNNGTAAITQVDVNGGAGADSLSIGPGVPSVNFEGSGGNDTVAAQNSAGDTLVGGDGNDSLSVTAGNNVLEGAGGLDTLIGGSGNDTIADGFVGNYTQIGIRTVTGTFPPTYTNSPSMVSIVSGSGSEVIEAVDNMDTIAGSTGGTDTIFATGTGDSITGSNNVMFSQFPIVQSVSHGTLVINGTNSNDTLTIAGTPASLTISGKKKTSSPESITVNIDGITQSMVSEKTLKSIQAFMGAGNDSVAVETDIGPIMIAGQDGNDTIVSTGAAGATGAQAAAGETLKGGNGDDSISTNLLLDNLQGGPGNDTLVGATRDTLEGNGGNDSLDGSAGAANLLIGGSGTDRLVGNIAGNGADTLVGGTGDSIESGMGDVINPTPTTKVLFS